nr:lipoprotein signal peptidase [Neisseria shayeganii]
MRNPPLRRISALCVYPRGAAHSLAYPDEGIPGFHVRCAVRLERHPYLEIL